MMTPVYEVAIADWQTNSCNIYSYAARLASSVIPTQNSINPDDTHSTKKHLFSCQSRHLNTHASIQFHIPTCETTHSLSQVKKPQPKRKPSLARNNPSKQGEIHFFSDSYLDSSEVNSPSYCNLANSGTDVLWQQAKFELILKKSESNVLHSYIKEQPAGPHTTTTTDKEK